MKRQDILHALIAARNKTVVSEEMRQQALGSWMYGLLEKSNPIGNGLNKREMRKQGDQVLKDSALLGAFSVDVADPEFAGSCFISRAER